MQIYLTSPPEAFREATRYTNRLAHLAYRINALGRMARNNLLQTRGGLMVLGDTEKAVLSNIPALCQDVWRECAGRNFAGVVASPVLPPRPDRTSFLVELGAIMTRNKRRLYVPEEYGQDVPQAQVLICTALSGGVLRDRLKEAQERFGSRVALDLQRLRMVFPLPCATGEGTDLTGEELARFLREDSPSVFYSADLCAKYFTRNRHGSCDFVLFDDADTLKRKIELGRSMEIASGFFLLEEVRDLLPGLFSQNP